MLWVEPRFCRASVSARAPRKSLCASSSSHPSDLAPCQDCICQYSPSLQTSKPTDIPKWITHATRVHGLFSMILVVLSPWVYVLISHIPPTIRTNYATGCRWSSMARRQGCRYFSCFLHTASHTSTSSVTLHTASDASAPSQQ